MTIALMLCAPGHVLAAVIRTTGSVETGVIGWTFFSSAMNVSLGLSAMGTGPGYVTSLSRVMLLRLLRPRYEREEVLA